jgi:hypothetical protein
MVSRASASSLAKACSSSYSPGLPMRSSIILPRFVYLKKKKIESTSTAMPAEPKADKIPIRMPFPVEPALMLMTTEDGPKLPACAICSCPNPWLSIVVDVDGLRLEEGVGSADVENVEGTGECSREVGRALDLMGARFCIAEVMVHNHRRNEVEARADGGR